jgi:hypothetical protein
MLGAASVAHTIPLLCPYFKHRHNFAPVTWPFSYCNWHRNTTKDCSFAVPFYPADTWQGAVCPVGGRSSDMAAISFGSRCKIFCLNKKNRAAASDLQIHHRVIKYLKPKNSKRTFQFNPPGFPKEHCCMKPCQTSSIFLLVKETYRWRWVWSFGKITLMGKEGSTEKNMSHCHFVCHKSQLEWLEIKPGPKIKWIIYKYPVRTAQ